MLAAYGAGIQPGPLTYDEWVGLALNLDRVRLQQSYAVAKGIELMFGGGKVGLGVFRAICETEEEAREAWIDTVMERQMAAVMGKSKLRK